MNKFITTPSSKLIRNADEFLSFFPFKSKIYPVGAKAKFNQYGIDTYNHGRIIRDVIIDDYYLVNNEERLVVHIYYNDTGWPYVFNGPSSILDMYFKEILEEPIVGDTTEYINYIKDYHDHYYDYNFTEEELIEMNIAWHQHKELSPELKERRRQVLTPKKRKKPCYKDWELPEVIFGWFIYISVIIGSCIFNNFAFQMAICIFACVYFSIWRNKKIYCKG